MSEIDDPLDAGKTRIDAERRSESPITRFVPQIAKIIEALPLEPLGLTGKSMKLIMNASAAWVSKTEQDRSAYLIECLGDEVRRVRGKLEGLAEVHEDFVREDFLPLVVDGLQKAEQIRSYERIKRIAAILANALEVGPRRAADVTEELMRIAANLNDQDVAVLRELVTGQQKFFDSVVGRSDFNEVNRYWAGADQLGYSQHERGPAAKLGMSQGELQMACAKLQSFGMVVQTEGSAAFRELGFPAFAILPRAIDFVDSIKALSSEDTQG